MPGTKEALKKELGAPPFKLFQPGNGKLPFLSWSTPPGFNCPGAADLGRILKETNLPAGVIASKRGAIQRRILDKPSKYRIGANSNGAPDHTRRATKRA